MFLGDDETLRLRNAVVLFAFLATLVMWLFQDNIRSMVTPIYLALPVHSSSSSSIDVHGSDGALSHMC